LSAKVKKTSGKGKHKKTKMTTETVGSGSFAALAVGSHAIRATLNSTGRKLLKHDHGKLTATATATYTAGAASNTATATITLHAAKKHKKHKK
jgi:hypothetical protein